MIHALHIYLLALAITWALLCAAGVFAFKFNIGYAALFAAIQIVGGMPWAPLVLAGVPICALLSTSNLITLNGTPGAVWHWQLNPWTWLWDNKIDGVVGPGPVTRWQAFYWSALRNPVNNLRFVPGVSKVGRPLWYRTWTIRGNLYYGKAGWMSDGFPAFSAGAGKGF